MWRWARKVEVSEKGRLNVAAVLAGAARRNVEGVDGVDSLGSRYGVWALFDASCGALAVNRRL